MHHIRQTITKISDSRTVLCAGVFSFATFAALCIGQHYEFMRGLFGALAVFAPAGVGLGAWAAVRDRRFGPLIYAVPAMLATSGYTWLFLQWLK